MARTRNLKPAAERKSPAGRKPLRPPADAVQRIEDLAADGFSKVGVARRLGVSLETLTRWLDEHHELRDAFDAGRENERYTLHNLLYRQATEKNNIVAAMFLLKSRHGYREGDQEQQANRVSINFTLPGARKPEPITIEQDEPEARVQPLPTSRA